MPITSCAKCGAPATVPWSTGVELCKACAAIEAHRIERRMRQHKLRSDIPCDHLWTPWARGRRKNSWWRRCERCKVEDDEISTHQPTEENDISWVEVAMRMG